MNQTFDWHAAPDAQYAVIGDPVGHSLSPVMHQAWLDAVGRNERYVALRVWSEELGEALEHLGRQGYVGLNATLPHKESLAMQLEHVDGFAKRIGSVNTVDLRTRWGANTDAPGFMATLDSLEIEPGSTALLLGAGGAARAVAAALSASGFVLRIWNRNRDRAEKLISELGLAAEVLSEIDLGGARLIVNATTGVGEAELPIDWSKHSQGAVAYDLMYGRKTAFLEQADQFGLKTIDGLPMLVEQGALSMELWTGDSVDRSVMLQAVEKANG